MTARRGNARVVGGAALLLGATAAGPAGAVEREHHLGLDLGAAMLVVADKGSPDFGPSAGAHWAYGLNDQFNLMVEGSWALLAIGEHAQDKTTPRTRPTNGAGAGVGLGYVFDVLSWVPYAGALVGGYALTGGTISGTTVLPDVTLALGLDYRFGRSWAAGVALREHLLPFDMSTYPTFTQLFARCEYTWGW